jgi:hypothetical protein
MKARELRIGNFIDYEKTTHIVQSLDRWHINSYWIKDVEGEELYRHPISQTEPIPLTEEWLLKLGFEFDVKIEYAIGIESVRYYKLNSIKIGIEESGKMEWYHSYQQAIVKLRYVHQLQNLFYSLTGTELSLAKNKTETNNANKTES